MRLFGGKALIAGPDGRAVRLRLDAGYSWFGRVAPSYVTQGTHHPPVFDGCAAGHSLAPADARRRRSSRDGGRRAQSRSADDRGRSRNDCLAAPNPPLTYRRGDWFRAALPPARSPIRHLGAAAPACDRALPPAPAAADRRRPPTSRLARPSCLLPALLLRSSATCPTVYREDPDRPRSSIGSWPTPKGSPPASRTGSRAAQALFDPRTCPPERWTGCSAGSTSPPILAGTTVGAACSCATRCGSSRSAERSPVIQCALRLALDPCVGRALFDDAGGQRGADPDRRAAPHPPCCPPSLLGDPTEPTRPRVVPLTARWKPGQGGDALDASAGGSHRRQRRRPSRSPSGG